MASKEVYGTMERLKELGDSITEARSMLPHTIEYAGDKEGVEISMGNFYELRDRIQRLILNADLLERNYHNFSKYERGELEKAKVKLEKAEHKLKIWDSYLKRIHKTGKFERSGYEIKSIREYLEDTLTDAVRYTDRLLKRKYKERHESGIDYGKTLMIIFLSLSSLIAFYFLLPYTPVEHTGLFSNATTYMSPLLVLSFLFFLAILLHFYRKK